MYQFDYKTATRKVKN